MTDPHLVRRWSLDLTSVSQRFFPKRPGMISGGNRFVTCCAFYDPPRDNLFDFWVASATSPGISLTKGWKTRKGEPLIAGSGLPVKTLPDPSRVAGRCEFITKGSSESWVSDTSSRLAWTWKNWSRKCLVTTRRELATLEDRRNRLKDLENDAATLLESYASMVPEALGNLEAEERNRVYKISAQGISVSRRNARG
jgi:hypothetical protein